MPFNDKLNWAEKRIKEFLDFVYHDYTTNPKYKDLKETDYKVMISFSGGKDSTVLLDIINKVHKKIKSKIYLQPAYAYEITFPETFSFIKQTIKRYKTKNKYILDLIVAKPKLPWYEILQTKGYPIFSKQVSVQLNRIKNTKSKSGMTNWIFGIDTSKFKLTKGRLFLLDDSMKDFSSCVNEENVQEFNEYFKNTLDFKNYTYSEKCCDYVKGGLKHHKMPCFVGVMATESELRKKSWIHYGCNILNKKRLLSRPLSIFKTSDIWKYIYKNRLEINKMYGYKPHARSYENSINKLNYTRLGCISCPYGSHLEDVSRNRFQILYNQSKQLYYSQVIATGMYKVLIDMGVEIPSDQLYMKLFKIRQKQIENWYKDFPTNLCKILCGIENIDNIKGFKYSKNRPTNWRYSFDEIKQIYKNYDIEIDDDKLLALVNNARATERQKYETK